MKFKEALEYAKTHGGLVHLSGDALWDDHTMAYGWNIDNDMFWTAGGTVGGKMSKPYEQDPYYPHKSFWNWNWSVNGVDPKPNPRRDKHDDKFIIDDELEPACWDCGMEYDENWADFIVPHDAWEKLTREDGAKLLCVSCMVDRAVRLNVTCVGAFTSGPIKSCSEEEIRKINFSLPKKKIKNGY